VKKKSVDEEGVEFIQGKVYTKVDKSDEYLQKVKGYIERYKEDLKTIKGWAEEKLKKFSIETCRLLWGPNSCSRPEWVIGIRGTEFTIEREGANTVKISVIEGSVEVTHNINNSKNESYEIPEGYEAIINGETLTKRKIEKLEKWWEK
jgi:hypothetical protein